MWRKHRLARKEHGWFRMDARGDERVVSVWGESTIQEAFGIWTVFPWISAGSEWMPEVSLREVIRNKRRVSNKCRGQKWACPTHWMHAELTCNCKTCVERSAIRQAIKVSRKCCLTFVEQLSFGASDGGKQPYRFEKKCPQSLIEGHRCHGRRSPGASAWRPCTCTHVCAPQLVRNKQ